MPFPSSGILDDFNRSDRNLTSDGGWDGPVATAATLGGLGITSNQCGARTSGSCAQTWNTDFTDCEAYVTVVVLPASSDNFGILLRVRQESGASNTYDGYLVRWERSTHDIVVTRSTDAAHTTIATFANAVSLSNGDQFGASMIGSTITAYAKVGAGAWTSYGTTTDATYTIGHPGLWIKGGTARLDNFGGGIPGSLQTRFFATLV